MQLLLHDASPEMLRKDDEFLVRVSFFDLLEPEARQTILRTRAEIVKKKLAHTQEMRALIHEQKAQPFTEEVLLFHEQQDQHELDWIESLMHKVSHKQVASRHLARSDGEHSRRSAALPGPDDRDFHRRLLP